MNAEQLVQRLTQACTGHDSAIRMTNRLVPAGGEGDKVFPPTYAGPEQGGKSQPVYATEARLVDGETVPTVLIDSVQSQANRMEEALLRAYDRGQCPIPVLEVTVAGMRVTSLDAPHRVFDAIFRDSLLDGVAFRKSPVGQAVIGATLRNATALYRYAPTALIYGAWDSHGMDNKGLGVKFPRVLTSELVGLHALPGRRTGGRIDPLGITKNAGPVQKLADDWELPDNPKGKKDLVKPSEIGHGNVAPGIQETGGVTVAEVRQTAVIALPQLRRLSFPDPDTGEVDEERNVTGRTVLAALALYALALQDEDGYWLRSRCHLTPVSDARYEVVGRTAGAVEPFELDVELARTVFLSAYERAAERGLTWQAGTITLAPSPKLTELVNRSRAMGADDAE